MFNLRDAVELIPSAECLLVTKDLPTLSLPFVIESLTDSTAVLISHFERGRSEFRTYLTANPEVKVVCIAGVHYIDPSWIPRSPHAPTEVKAVYELYGRVELIDRPASQTLQMLSQVTHAKQKLFGVHSQFTVEALPSEYTNRMLPNVQEFLFTVDRCVLSRLMVLQHLSVEHRRHVIETLRSAVSSPAAIASAELIERFIRKAGNE